jgi:hypothetical protein
MKTIYRDNQHGVMVKYKVHHTCQAESKHPPPRPEPFTINGKLSPWL